MDKFITLHSGIPAYDLRELIKTLEADDGLLITNRQAVINARSCVAELGDGYRATSTADPVGVLVERLANGNTVFLHNWVSFNTIEQLTVLLKIGDGLQTIHPVTARNFFAVAQYAPGLKVTHVAGETRIERIERIERIGPEAAEAAEAAEQDEFNVLLLDVGPKRLSVIKAVREMMDLSLAEAKNLVDADGFLGTFPKAVAETFLQKLLDAGAQAQIH